MTVNEVNKILSPLSACVLLGHGTNKETKACT